MLFSVADGLILDLWILSFLNFLSFFYRIQQFLNSLLVYLLCVEMCWLDLILRKSNWLVNIYEGKRELLINLKTLHKFKRKKGNYFRPLSLVYGNYLNNIIYFFILFRHFEWTFHTGYLIFHSSVYSQVFSHNDIGSKSGFITYFSQQVMPS